MISAQKEMLHFRGLLKIEKTIQSETTTIKKNKKKESGLKISKTHYIGTAQQQK